jgi:hypothetical protein
MITIGTIKITMGTIKITISTTVVIISSGIMHQHQHHHHHCANSWTHTDRATAMACVYIPAQKPSEEEEVRVDPDLLPRDAVDILRGKLSLPFFDFHTHIMPVISSALIIRASFLLSE